MTDHETAGAQCDAAAAKLWDERFTIADRALDLQLLAIAHFARALDPTAHHVYLTEHDEADNMTFNYVSGDTYWWGPDQEKSTDNQREMDDTDVESWDDIVRMIAPSDLYQADYWIEQGDRRTGHKGELLVQIILDTLGPKHQAVLDPMPDPTDLVAVREWLTRQEAKQ